MPTYAKKSPALELHRKRTAAAEHLRGREGASAASVAAAFDLDVEWVRATMRVNGVRDDG